MSIKDLQRQRLYKAENAARQTAKKNSDLRWLFFSDLEETHDHAFDFANLLDIKLASFDRKRGARGAYAQKWRMAIVFPNAAWALNAYVVVHELTHLQVTSAFPSHGLEYARQFLRNTHVALGPDAWQILKSAFDKDGIKYAYDDAHQKHVERVIKYKLKQLAADADETTWAFDVVTKEGEFVYGPAGYHSDDKNAELGRKAYSLVEAGEVSYVT